MAMTLMLIMMMVMLMMMLIMIMMMLMMKVNRNIIFYRSCGGCCIRWSIVLIIWVEDDVSYIRRRLVYIRSFLVIVSLVSRFVCKPTVNSRQSNGMAQRALFLVEFIKFIRYF